MEQRRLAILGSTGTLGQTAIEVANDNDHFKVEVLTANTNASLLVDQAMMLKPDSVVIVDDTLYQEVNDKLWEHDIKVYAGTPSISQVCEGDNIDMVVNAIRGIHGLEPTITALNHHKVVAMGCDEAIVCGSKLLLDAVKSSRGALVPIDNQLNTLFRLVQRSGLANLNSLLISAQAANKTGNVTADFNAFKKAFYLQQVEHFIASQFYFGLNAENVHFQISENHGVLGAIALNDGTTLYCTQGAEPGSSLEFAMHFPGFKKNNNTVTQHRFESIILTPPDQHFISIIELAKKYLSGKDIYNGWKLNAAVEAAFEQLRHDQVSFGTIADLIKKAFATDETAPKSISELITAHQALKRQLLS